MPKIKMKSGPKPRVQDYFKFGAVSDSFQETPGPQTPSSESMYRVLFLEKAQNSGQ